MPDPPSDLDDEDDALASFDDLDFDSLDDDSDLDGDLDL